MQPNPEPLTDSQVGQRRSHRVLVTGATGYIGGRLVPRLLAEGYRVRCLVRSPRKLEQHSWVHHPNLEVMEGDLRQPEHIEKGVRGCQSAYYLVHSMLATDAHYAQLDRDMARSFGKAAAEHGVTRILYLGGLGETGKNLSEHLSSRREVEGELAASGVSVTVLRAAMIIGSGSASFEIMRYLMERLPVMVTPRWVRTRCQPIAVRDVLHYLTAALGNEDTTGETYDIGGPDVMTYAEIIQLMASVRGLPRRRVIPVPILTPRLSSLWIHLVTPISASIARPLAEGLRNEVVIRDDRAQQQMPKALLTVRESIEAATDRQRRGVVETRWSDAGVMPGDPEWAGGTVFEDPRSVEIDAPAQAVYQAVCRVGGGHGWYAADWLWKLRGAIDKIVGGPGLRRGRRHPEQVGFGEALDFWRVAAIEPNRHLELRAEMRLPGIATLTFDIEPMDGPGGPDTRAKLTQTARFRPMGLSGLAYWYGVLPLHGFVFRGMMRGIRRASEALAHSA